MKVLILGFKANEYNLLAAEMEKLIMESQCYLFTVICSSPRSIGYIWAEKNGCAVEFVPNTGFPPVKMIDFVLAKINDNTPATIRNYVMQVKAAGGHGRIIR